MYWYLPLPECSKRALLTRVSSTGRPVAKTTTRWGFLHGFAGRICAVVGPAQCKAAVESALSAGFSAAGIRRRTKQGSRVPLLQVWRGASQGTGYGQGLNSGACKRGKAVVERGDDIVFSSSGSCRFTVASRVSLCACWLCLLCLLWPVLEQRVSELSKTGEGPALACSAVVVKWSVSRRQLLRGPRRLAGRGGTDSWFAMFHGLVAVRSAAALHARESVGDSAGEHLNASHRQQTMTETAPFNPSDSAAS